MTKIQLSAGPVKRQSPRKLINCLCGCGQIVYGKYKNGHEPSTSYRVKGLKRVHVLRAEKALGRPLPKGAHVHHADLSRGDCAPLIICQDAKYHKLLHKRTRIYRAGGNPNTDSWCSNCGPKHNSYFWKRSNGSHTAYCKECSKKAVTSWLKKDKNV